MKTDERAAGYAANAVKRLRDNAVALRNMATDNETLADFIEAERVLITSLQAVVRELSPRAQAS